MAKASTMPQVRSEATTGCSSGHVCLVMGATGLPKSSRTAATNVLIGFHAATHWSASGSDSMGTNAVLRNVSGKTMTNATPMTASGERTVMPIHVPTQIMADE